MKDQKKGWLESLSQDAEFNKLLAREEFVESFLDAIETAMRDVHISRSDLARRLECSPANVTRMFRRTSNLSASTMSDLAFVLNLVVSARLEVGKKWFHEEEVPHFKPARRPWASEVGVPSMRVTEPAEAAF